MYSIFSQLTLQFHAHLEALLESTVGTTFALSLIDVTGSFRDAGVDLLVLHGALEEALAGFAGEQAVMITAHLVTADGAQLLKEMLEIDGFAVAIARGGTGAAMMATSSASAAYASTSSAGHMTTGSSGRAGRSIATGTTTTASGRWQQHVAGRASARVARSTANTIQQLAGTASCGGATTAVATLLRVRGVCLLIACREYIL